MSAAICFGAPQTPVSLFKFNAQALPPPPAMEVGTIQTGPTIIRTMSSREIAELTGKRHDHILFDIRKMLEELERWAPEFSGTYIHPQNGQKYVEFRLPKDLTLTLVSGDTVN